MREHAHYELDIFIFPPLVEPFSVESDPGLNVGLTLTTGTVEVCFSEP